MKQTYPPILFFLLFVFSTLSAKPVNFPPATIIRPGNKTVAVGAIISGTTSVCLNAAQPQITFTGSGGTAPYTFTYTISGGSPLTAVSNGAGIATVSAPTNATGSFIYNLTTVTETTGSPVSINDSAVITVVAPPVAAFTAPITVNCATQALSFTNTSTGNLTYLWDFDNPDSGTNNSSTSANPSHTFITTPGNSNQTFNVTLTVTNATGCSDSVIHTVTVKQIPDASFDTTNNNGSFYDSIQGLFLNCDATISNPNFTLDLFNGSSTTPSNSSYSINWGDSTPIETVSTFNEITHDYTTLGYFNIILSVTNNNTSCISTKLYRFFNGNSPAGNLDLLGNADDCAPYSFTWPVQNTQNNPPGTNYAFSVNDGSPPQTWTQETLPNTITHNFTQSSCGLPANKFTVTFQITNPCATNAPTTQVQVSQKPVASFTINQQACTNNIVSLTNTSIGNYFSGQNCLTNFNRTWTISPSTGWTVTSGQLTNSNNVQIQFTTSGEYSISLNIHRPNSQSNDCTDDTHTETICVDNPLTTPTFTLNNIQGCAPLNVSATNTTNITSICNSPITYAWTISYSNNGCGNSNPTWNYTNGTSSTSASPSFNFVTPGTYTIKVTMNNGCGAIQSTAIQTIIVKAPPLVTLANITNVCGGSSAVIHPTATITSCSSNTPAYLWDFPGGNPATSTNADPGSISYTTSGTHTVTLTVTNECGSTIKTQDFTVNSSPIMTAVPDQIKCKGEPTTSITFGSDLTGTTYTWTNSNTAIGLAANGNNNSIPSFTTTNNTNAPITATITVTPHYNGCTGAVQTFTITVYPMPVVNVVANNILCNGASQNAINFNSAVSGTIFNWTNSAPSIGLAASGTGNIASFTALNTGTTPVIATITISPSNAQGCNGTSTTFTITVNPTPAAMTLTNADLCNGAASPGILFNNSVAGTTYTWTNNNTSIGIAASGTGNIPAFTPVNTGNTPVTATITVIPHLGSCTGAPQTLTITVSPSPIVQFSTPNQTICSGEAISPVTLTSPTTGVNFSWTAAVPAGVTGVIPSGTDTIPVQTLNNSTNAPVTVQYNASGALSGGAACPGSAFTYTVIVKPKPALTTITTSTCSGTAFTVTPVNSTDGTVPAATQYSWAAPATQSGISGLAAGSGSSITGTLTNSTAADATVTYIVTPVANGCTGSTFNVLVTIHPAPTVNTIANQTVCNGTSTTAISFTSPVSGTTFTWTNNNTSIGLSGNSTGDIAAFPAINNGNAPVTATITVTPHIGNCTGTPQSFTITVNPAPAVTFSQTNQSICSGSASSVVNLSSTTTGVAISWTASQPSGISGVALSGSNAIPSQTLVNNTNAAIDVVYTATAATTGVSCPGATYNYTITVKPQPNITTPQTTTICSGDTFSITPVNGGGNTVPAATQYTWTVPANNDITGESNQSTAQNNISQTLVNTTNTDILLTYTVIPVANGCSGTSFPVMVTVNPKPFVTSQTATICSGGTFTITPANGSGNIVPASTTYSWPAPTLSGGITGEFAGTNSTTISGTLTNTTNTSQTATYTVTPKWVSNSETCIGNPFTVTVTVNPKPAISNMTQNSCSGTPFTITPVDGTNGTVPSGTVYSWAAPIAQAGVSGLAAGTNSPAISGNITNTTNAAVAITFVVTPVANGCTGTTFNVALTIAPTPTVAAVNNQTVCNQSNTSAITFSGTITGTTYNWTNSNTSIGLPASGSGNIAAFIALNSGTTPITSTITVIPEINGCNGASQTFTVNVNPAPSVIFSQNDQTICSGSTTTVVNLSSATPNTTISWTATQPAGITGVASSGGTTIPVQNLVNTTNAPITITYTASATTSDASACPGAMSPYTITVTPVPFVNGTPQISSCSGTALNYIPANTGGNNMPTGVTFTWTAPAGSGFTGGSAQSTPQTSLNQTLVNTTNAAVIATYTVTPHYNGCNGVPFTVAVTINPTAVIPNASLTICSGVTFTFDPSITATLFPAGTVFNWGAPSGTITGGAAGSAQSIITGTLNNATASVQTATYTITPVSPQGNCNGASFTLTVTVNPIFAVTHTVSNYNGFQISSAGANDAFINLSPTGGTGSYTYSWTGPNGFTASSQNIANLGPGTYTVVISDGLCSNITITVTIAEPMPLVIAEVTASHINVNCYGQSTGVIEVAVTTVSIAPFDYAILLPDGTVVENIDNLTALNYVFDNLPAGTYNIRVTDANGTIKYINGVQVTQPASGLAITGSVVSNFNGFSISCNGANDGSINLTVSGGYPAYTYSWTGPNGFTATTEDIAALAPGVYTVTILDTTNACPVTQSFTITEPQPVTFTGAMSAFNGYQISCFSGNNGSIAIIPAGGTGVYTYSWTGPNGFTASTQNISNLTIGTYELTLTDNNGCGAPTQSFTLTQPTALAITESHVNVLCFGAATGAIDVTVTGGVANGSGTYTFAWTGPNGFTASSEDLVTIVAGTYNLLVTDTNGCTIPLSVTVTQQPEIIITPTTTPITCYGANNASISLNIIGGNPPYTADWSNLATGTYQDNLAAGIYTITVTDASSCVKVIAVPIPEAPVFKVEPVFANVSCHGAHDGSITLNLTGGIAPVTLVWSDGSTAGTQRNNLGPGTYTATITDGTPCQIIRTFTIVEPASLTVTANLTHALDCNNTMSGAIDLLVAGGTPPYNYNWSNGQTTEDLTAITSGTYSVTITDASGCTVSGTYIITRPAPINLNVTSDVVHNCDTHYVRQTNVAQASGGVPPFQYTWSSGTVSGAFGQLMNTDQNGTVIVTATDSEGCTATSTFEVHTEQLGEANFTAGSYAFTTYQEYSISDPVQFDNLSTGDYSEVGWDFGDGGSSSELSPSHTYLNEGTYTVTLHVVYPYGCSDTYHITLVVTKGYDVMVPNAFTPNADGINDTFNAVHRGLKSIELNVFDTWGALIYSEKGEVITGWSGSTKGNPSENGNFYYRIKAETFYGQIIEFNGPFVLIK